MFLVKTYENTKIFPVKLSNYTILSLFPYTAPLTITEKLRKLMTEDDREGVDAAFKEATEQTLWERITKTNHKDVMYYKGLLQEYTRDLMMVMREDFFEEITGHHVKNKTFEND